MENVAQNYKTSVSLPEKENDFFFAVPHTYLLYKNKEKLF